MGSMIGLDIGQHSIKATLFEGSFGRYSFRGTEEEIISDNDSELSLRKNAALRRLLLRIKVGNNNVVSCLPSSLISVRKLSVPFTDRSKIEIVLPTLIEEQVPFEIDDVTIQHRVIDSDDEGSDLLTLIVPSQTIEEHLEYLEEHSINPKHLMVDADALSYFATEGVQGYIDLGSSKVICALYKDGKTICFRSLPVGLSSVPNLANLDLSLEEDCEHLDALLNGIRRTLINFEDQFSVHIDEVIVSGGGINIPHMTDLLRQDLGVPLQKANLPRGLSPEWALAYALGQKAAGSTQGREFDLRVGSFAYQGNLQRIGQLVTVSLIASVVAVIGSGVWFGLKYQEFQKSKTELEQEIVTEVSKSFPDLQEQILSSPSMAKSLMQEEVTSAQEKLKKLGSIISEEPPILSLIKELSEGVPPHSKARIDVRELIISKSSINIKAETDGFQTATAIESALRQKPRFKTAQKADEKSKRDAIEFSINIQLVQPDDEQNPEDG